LDSLSHNGPRRLFVPTYQTDHSEKGWVNKYIWPRYLRFLRNQIPCKEGTELNDPVNTIYLFADAYRTHHSTELVAYAKTLNIIMIEIPKGTTDQCQPLDCRIFGILKSQARAYYNRRVGKYIREHYEDLRKGAKIPPINPITIKQSAFLLDLLWNDIKEYHIHSAWHTAFDMDRDENDKATEKDMDEIEKNEDYYDEEEKDPDVEEEINEDHHVPENQNEHVAEIQNEDDNEDDEEEEDDKNDDEWIG
jgi:hypothetical protein